MGENVALTNFMTREFTVDLSLDTSAYAADDVLADMQEVELAPALPTGRKLRGRVLSVVVLDKSDQGAAIDLVLANAEVSLGTENAAVSMSDADAENVVGVVAVSSYVDLVNSRLARPSFDPVEFQANTGSLWVGAIIRGTGTYAADGIQLRIAVQFDNVRG